MAGKPNNPRPAPSAVRAGETKSVSVRKISNGYVVTESSMGPRGTYKSTETYSEKPPTVQAPKPTQKGK